jgi:hypothetical protein
MLMRMKLIIRNINFMMKKRKDSIRKAKVRKDLKWGDGG